MHSQVELLVDDQHFTLHTLPDRTLLGVHHRDAIKIDKRIGNLPREIALNNGDLLSVTADEQLHHWLDHPQHAASAWSLSSLENSKKWALLSVILAPLLLVGIFKFVIPAMAVTFAAYVPYTLKDVASRHTLAALDQSVLSPSELDTDKQQHLTRHFDAVIDALHLPQQGLRIEFRQSDSMGANAFALPNGTIVMTDQLVHLVDYNEAQLSAILLHEIGHITQQHAMRLVAETIATTMVITYFFGDVSGVFETFAGASNTLINNQFSQKLESEADDFALAHAHVANLTAHDFAEALESLASEQYQEHDIDKLFSSHPLLKDRIEKARAAQHNQSSKQVTIAPE